MAETYCFVNKKGGVGKSTFASIIAQLLAILGNRVLAIDNDEQHNLSKLLGLKVQKVGIADLYKKKYTHEEFAMNSIVESNTDNLGCITSSHGLSRLRVQDNQILKNFVRSDIITNNFDYVIIDCAPGISDKTDCAIYASDKFIIPVIMKQLALDGLTEMMRTLIKDYAVNKENIFIVPNMVRKINRHQAVLMAIKQLFPDNTIRFEIPLDESLDELATDSEEKVLFINRYSAPCVAHFLNATLEIFKYDEDKLYESITEKRKDYRSEIARRNFKKRKMVLQTN